jgi:hypothetical protein
VFDCPASVEELQELFEGRSIAERPTILTRVIACHNVHLDKRNAAKMEGLFQSILDFVCQSFESSTSLTVANSMIR